MIWNTGLRSKIVMLLIFPFLGIFCLAALIISDKLTVFNESESLVDLAQLSVNVGNLLQETQKERGLSSLFVSSNGTKGLNNLSAQRLLTDQKISNLTHFIDTHSNTVSTEVSVNLKAAQDLLSQLDAKRKMASALTITPQEIIAYYSNINQHLLKSMGTIISKTSNADLTRFSIAYLSVLHAKEEMGLERAQLSNVFTANKFAPGQFFMVASLMAAQEVYLQVFSTTAPPDVWAFFQSQMQNPVVTQVLELERVAKEKEVTGSFGIDSETWFKTMTSKIDLLKEVENRMSATIIERAGAMRSQAEQALLITVATVIGLFVLALIFALILARSIVSPVRKLTSIANKVSMGDIQQEVDVKATGEVGDLAESFTRMVNAFKMMAAMMSPPEDSSSSSKGA